MKAVENYKSKYFSFEVSEGVALSFVLFVGLLTTMFSYRYVSLSHIDMLPMIYREANPNFLLNDFFTNSSQLFNEDFVFAKFVAGLGGVDGIPLVVFALTLIANIGIGLVAFYFAKDISKDNHLNGMIAALLILSLHTFQWGNRAEIFRYDLTPEHLIMPLLILCIWQGLKQNILKAGLFAALASIIHPLSGPGIGGIMLLQILIVKIYRSELNMSVVKQFLIAGFLISIPAVIYLISYLQSFEYQMTDALFIEIMKMRFPHHYLPSTFLTAEKLLTGIVFISVAIFSWLRLRSSIVNSKTIYLSLVCLTAILGVICFIGWFFAEIFPNRFIITLHLWRFLTIIKILGLLGTALFLGKQLSDLHTKSPSLKLLLILGCFLVFFFYYAVEPILLACFAILLLTLFFSKKIYWTGLVLMLVFVLYNNVAPSGSKLFNTPSLNYFKSKIKISDLDDPEAKLAAFIRDNTADSSRLLCGPRNGRLRILAERALVIDATGIPMNDKGLEEWWSRINVVYLRNQDKKLSHIKQTVRFYNQLKDEDFTELKEELAFDYAVVDAQHKSDFLVLYKNRHLKLLEMPK
jgi:hypothetical protein